MPKSEEFRQAMIEGWAEAKKAKAERRAANREAWAKSPKNAANQREQTLGAVTPEIPIDPIEDAVAASGALARMRAIMADPNAQLYRRIDAADVVLSYELGPGAAAGIDPEQIAAPAYRFLKAVAGAADTPEALQFKALKLIVGIENSRKAAVQSSEQHFAKRELLCRLVNSERQRMLRDAGRWAGVVAQREIWALTLNDDFPWIEGWPGGWQWPPSDFGERLERARRKPKAELQANDEAFRAQLRAVRACNRVDDWQRLLAVAEG
jgi:hypothetical protein